MVSIVSTDKRKTKCDKMALTRILCPKGALNLFCLHKIYLIRFGAVITTHTIVSVNNIIANT